MNGTELFATVTRDLEVVRVTAVRHGIRVQLRPDQYYAALQDLGATWLLGQPRFDMSRNAVDPLPERRFCASGRFFREMIGFPARTYTGAALRVIRARAHHQPSRTTQGATQ